MLSAFIPDGYNLDGFIEGADGCYPSVAFEYRPIRIYDKTKMTVDMTKCVDDVGNVEIIAAEEVVKQLMSWDVTDPDGQPVEINRDNFLKLHSVVASKIFDIVCGNKASSIKADNEKN